MPWRSRLILPMALASLLAAQLLGPGAERRSQQENRRLEACLLGSHAVLVDYFWFDLLQYFGAYRLGAHGLEEFIARSERLFALDPAFPWAYIFASVVRADDMDDPRGAIEWLARAEAANPDVWFYPYEQGFIYYLRLGEYESAEAAFARVGRCPDAPGSWRHFTARIHELGGDPRLARELWMEVARTATHPDIRERAIRNADRLDALLRRGAESDI
jgi:tetratricopeptide (TPR) repeat protein